MTKTKQKPPETPEEKIDRLIADHLARK